MNRPRVYVETTIPSFYFEKRTSAIMVARRKWTRAWWEIALERFELVTGPPVAKELLDGPESRHEEWLSLISAVPVLDVTDVAEAAAAAYVQHRLMPRGGEDALHLALASFHRCDFLVTWNMRHLANGMKYNHIQKINEMLGLHVPTVITPLGLLGRLA